MTLHNLAFIVIQKELRSAVVEGYTLFGSLISNDSVVKEKFRETFEKIFINFEIKYEQQLEKFF